MFSGLCRLRKSIVVFMAALYMCLASSVAASPAVSWKQIDLPPESATTWLGEIAYGSGRFVVVGAEGTILTSTDGEAFEKVPFDSDSWLYRVAYKNGKFLCVGSDGLSFVSYISVDGLKWSGPYSIAPYGGASLTRIDSWRGQFVVFVRESGTGYVSVDGVCWSELPSKVTTGLVSDASVVDDLLVVCGATWAPPGTRTIDGTMGSFIVTSTDGMSWSTAYSDPYMHVYDVVNGVDVVLAGGGALRSTDGIHWQVVRAAETLGVYPSRVMAYEGGWFVAAGRYSDGDDYSVLVSRNGSQWTPVPPGAGITPWYIAFGGGKFVGTGANAKLLSLVLPDATFLDVPDTDPVHEAVELLAARKVVGGVEDGLFHPERNVTRAEYAKMLVVSLGLEPDPSTPVTFRDVSGHWSVEQGFLQTAVSTGTIDGYPDNTFRPDGVVTRAEAAKMTAAASGLRPNGMPPYQDVIPGDWFAGWVSSAWQADLIGPGSLFPIWGDQFGGNELCTRAEAALVLANLLSSQ